jgi:hypothetical protein
LGFFIFHNPKLGSAVRRLARTSRRPLATASARLSHPSSNLQGADEVMTTTNADNAAVFTSFPISSAARERAPDNAAAPDWDWMDEVLDASFPASDPPSFAPMRLGKPPRR